MPPTEYLVLDSAGNVSESVHHLSNRIDAGVNF